MVNNSIVHSVAAPRSKYDSFIETKVTMQSRVFFLIYLFKPVCTVINLVEIGRLVGWTSTKQVDHSSVILIILFLRNANNALLRDMLYSADTR